MQSVGTYEAKTNFSQLLERVAGGEHITITRHGVPVAVLQPPVAPRKRSSREAIEEIKQLRKGRTLGDLTIREMIEEGRD